MRRIPSSQFDVPDGIGPLQGQTSVLLTGDDADAMRSVYARIVAPDEDERTVLVDTERPGRSVKQSLNDARGQSADRAAILTSRGSPGEGVTTVGDLRDLTGLGMQFSSLVTEAKMETQQFRIGLFLCSSLAAELDDTRSLYRFLNSTFLTEVRRGDGIGVCAIDTTQDFGANVESTITGLRTSFNRHIHVKSNARDSDALTVDDTTTLDVSV